MTNTEINTVVENLTAGDTVDVSYISRRKIRRMVCTVTVKKAGAAYVLLAPSDGSGVRPMNANAAGVFKFPTNAAVCDVVAVDVL